MAVTSLVTLHPGQTAALFGRGVELPAWQSRPKQPPPSRRYVAGILATVTTFMIAAFGEELLRCYARKTRRG